MATISPSTFSDNGDGLSRGVDRIRWVLAAGDDAAPITAPGFSDRTVQISGTFGGATVALQGRVASDLPWESLTDPQGNAISKTASSLEQVTENPYQIRPAITGGDGTTSVVITLQSRRNA